MKMKHVGLGAAVLIVALSIGLGPRLLQTIPGMERLVSGRSGGALIGGPFTLIDGAGRSVTSETFAGQWRLMFFGYTYCPDVCPTELTLMAEALDLLNVETAARITPIFVSVDPERDTPDLIADYVLNFHDRMVGLTGTPEQTAEAARQFRVYYQKAIEEGQSPDDYLVDHSTFVYLMDPNGVYVRHFSYGTEPETMARGLKAALNAAG